MCSLPSFLAALIVCSTIWLSQLVAPARAVVKPAKELPIAVKVSPSSCFSPCSITITLRIPRFADNRYAVVEVDGEEFHSSIIQLEGEQAAVTHVVRYVVQLPGEYVVKGVLFNSIKEVSRQVQSLQVQ